jgi:RNA polymerase-binding transcription factor
MTPEESAHIDARLRALREEVLAEREAGAKDAATVELDQSRVGRLSRMDAMQQQAMAVALNRRLDIRLKRIEGAFQRLEKGAYGRCVTCRITIPEERLEFDPTAFFCQECAARAERR